MLETQTENTKKKPTGYGISEKTADDALFLLLNVGEKEDAIFDEKNMLTSTEHPFGLDVKINDQRHQYTYSIIFFTSDDEDGMKRWLIQQIRNMILEKAEFHYVRDILFLDSQQNKLNKYFEFFAGQTVFLAGPFDISSQNWNIAVQEIGSLFLLLKTHFSVPFHKVRKTKDDKMTDEKLETPCFNYLIE